MPDVYVFDRWETPSGTFYSDTSCTTYCLGSTHDTIYAKYEMQTMCLGISPYNSAYRDTSLVIEFELEPLDSGYTAFNINSPKKFHLSNCGTARLDLQLKWVSTTNMSPYICPPIELTNSSMPGFNEIGLRGGLGSLTMPPSSYDVIKNYYTELETNFIPGDNSYLYIGVVSPEDYHPCYPPGVSIEYKIKLKLMWGVHLP